MTGRFYIFKYKTAQIIILPFYQNSFEDRISQVDNRFLKI